MGNDARKLIQIAVPPDNSDDGTILIEHYFGCEKLPVVGRAVNVEIDGVLMSVWNFFDVRAAEKFRKEFDGIDVATLGEDWMKPKGARPISQVTINNWS